MGKALARLALALLAAHLLVGIPLALGRSARRVLAFAPHADEDPRAARREVFGAAWVDGIERIRRLIPEGGAYALVDAQPVEQGAHYWLRHDLAPRKALFLGHLRSLARPRRLQAQMPAEIRWAVVVTAADQPPRLLTVAELLDEAARNGRRRARAHQRPQAAVAGAPRRGHGKVRTAVPAEIRVR